MLNRTDSPLAFHSIFWLVKKIFQHDVALKDERRVFTKQIITGTEYNEPYSIAVALWF